MIWKHFLAAALAATMFTTSAGASVTITTTGNSATDGTDGNIRTFTNGGITVQASGWSYDGNTLERAFLGAYSSGLGVTNNSEGNGQTNSNHTADNVGQSDFILLIFNQAVNIASATLIPFDVSPDPNDNDAWVSYATLAGAFTNPATPLTTGSSVWTTLNNNDWNVSGNMTSPYGTSLNSAGLFGNVWIIGSSRPNLDSNDDGFKLKSIVVTPGAVPEPSTWAMMLLGFGAVGAALRRSRKLGERVPQIA